MMTHEEFMTWLEEREACGPAVAWVREHKHTPESAWAACERGDCMLWLVREAGPTVEQARGAVKVARRCAERAAAAEVLVGASGPAMYAAAEANAAKASARELASAADAAKVPAKAATWATAAATLSADAAGMAAKSAAPGDATARWAAWSEARAAEFAACAQDCRELIPAPTIQEPTP